MYACVCHICMRVCVCLLKFHKLFSPPKSCVQFNICNRGRDMGLLQLVGSHKIIGLFCKRALRKRRYSAKETYNSKEPTNHSHPIPYTFCQNTYRCIFLFIFIHVTVCINVKGHTYLQKNYALNQVFFFLQKSSVHMDTRMIA